ncbi:hypothetical protein TIFTF001_056722 [Ficus carica]|uniref:Uncharacterized protein n=1 Tax=Ficus carica TaxID=3494 RepID=A0AA88JII6_FICCA|nr:hypothetical protein TIFTF001_056722 [Ficus carica]
MLTRSRILVHDFGSQFSTNQFDSNSEHGCGNLLNFCLQPVLEITAWIQRFSFFPDELSWMLPRFFEFLAVVIF